MKTDPGATAAVSPEELVGSGMAWNRDELNRILVFRLKMKSVALFGDGSPERLRSISTAWPTVNAERLLGDDNVNTAAARAGADIRVRTKHRDQMILRETIIPSRRVRDAVTVAGQGPD